MNSVDVTLASDDDGNVILCFEVRFQECLDEALDGMEDEGWGWEDEGWDEGWSWEDGMKAGVERMKVWMGLGR